MPETEPTPNGLEERNGFVIFHESPQKFPNHPAVIALNGLSFEHVVFPFGFYLQEIEGKRVLVAADSVDYEKAVSKIALMPLAGSTLKNYAKHCSRDQAGLECKEAKKERCPTGTACKMIFGASTKYYLCACL